jgi:hypothetical protein
VCTLAFVPPLLRHGLLDLVIVQPGSARYRPPAKSLDEPLGAPPPLIVDAALIACEAALHAYGSRQATVFAVLATTPVLFAATWLPYRAREWAGKRAAQRLGVTGATSPHPVRAAVALHMALTLGATMPRAWARLRGRRPEPVPFWLYAATYAVHQFNLRRSWWRAYAAARASQDLSSASSRTSGVCAPDTP